MPRAYATLMADVRAQLQRRLRRGVGANEQQDQVELVKWAAAQKWSSARSASWEVLRRDTPCRPPQAPKALKAIAVIAPVVSAYEDWHTAVPNGEQH